jgi:hypothetical protein
MPPKKSTEAKATAKGKAEEKTGTSQIVIKKEANNNVKVEPKVKVELNVKDEPNIKLPPHHETKPAIKKESADERAENAAHHNHWHNVSEHTPSSFKRPRRAPKMNTDAHSETKPAIKMESSDEGAEDTAYQGTPEPKTFKRGPRRAPKMNADAHNETKPAIKMESADEDAEDTADEGVPKPETPKRRSGRVAKMNTDAPIYGTGPEYDRKPKADLPIIPRGSSRHLKTEEEKKVDMSQVPKVPGGWVYASEGVTAEESRVVAKGKNGGAKFPWVSIITMKKYVPSSHSQSIVQPNLQVRGEPIEYHHHEHRTAYLVVSGGGIAILSKKDGMPAFDSSESAISGVLDKQSEVFIVLKNTKYRIGLQFKTVKYVEGHEVLDAATRDLWIVSGEIEWDDAVGSHAVGKVTREVVDGGDVSGRVMAAWQAAKQDHPAWKALLEERREIDATFKHRGDRTDVIQRDGDNGSPLNFSENDEPEPFGLDSDVSEKGKDAGTAKEKDESKKAIKKEDPKKERGTRGRSVRVKK